MTDLEYVDFVLHVPLEAEWAEVQKVFQFGENLTSGNNALYRLVLDGGLSELGELPSYAA